MTIRYKGMLGDDHVHLTAKEMIEHRVREQYEKENAVLKKLANNPAIDKEVREVVWKAIFRSQDLMWYRGVCSELQEEHDPLKKEYEVLKRRYENLLNSHVNLLKEVGKIGPDP